MAQQNRSSAIVEPPCSTPTELGALAQAEQVATSCQIRVIQQTEQDNELLQLTNRSTPAMGEPEPMTPSGANHHRGLRAEQTATASATSESNSSTGDGQRPAGNQRGSISSSGVSDHQVLLSTRNKSDVSSSTVAKQIELNMNSRATAHNRSTCCRHNNNKNNSDNHHHLNHNLHHHRQHLQLNHPTILTSNRLCSNHQHMASPHFRKLVNANHLQAQQQQHLHLSHCALHQAQFSNQNHHHNHHHLQPTAQHHDYIGPGSGSETHLRPCQRLHSLPPQGSMSKQSPFVVSKQARLEHASDLHTSGSGDERSRRRQRRERLLHIATDRRDISLTSDEFIVQQQQQQPTSKRTTMPFISQLYFLIHLSAILSLLLHHKNLVTSEIWRPGQRHSASQDHESIRTLDLPVVNVAKRHSDQQQQQNHETTQMPSHINQLPIPLMLLSAVSPTNNRLPLAPSGGTISSYVGSSSPIESDPRSSDWPHHHHSSTGQRTRRTLPQMLITPAVGADILVRLFGYRHARWALHYFLAYLLSSSITLLICLRIFHGGKQARSEKCRACKSLSSSLWQLGQSGGNSENLVGGQQEQQQQVATNFQIKPTTFGGFYYRTRLDCTPVLIGSISLGLIQLIVIGLDVAARVDWFAPTSKLGAGSPTAQQQQQQQQNESRWPIYLPFLQFAFVSLLMQYILSRVAKNKNQAPAAAVAHETLVGASARQLASTRRRRRLLPISSGGGETANATKSPLHLLVPDSLASFNQEHQWRMQRRLHQMNQMEENNGKSGLQNIALAHLLVTHILLWLMKLNSIGLFQAIEQQTSYSYHAHHHHSQSSRPLLIVPPAQIAQRDIGSPQQGREFVAEDKPELANRSNSGQQQLSTSVSPQPTTLASPRNELRQHFDRSEREFNRTELERILRTRPSSPSLPSPSPPPHLAATTVNSTQQVGPATAVVVVADQQTRAAPASKDKVGNSAHQGAPPDNKAVPLADDQQVPKQSPLVEPKAVERGLRSASDAERPAKQSQQPTAATTVANNDSVLMMSRAELANLLELATKNVQRLQPAPAAAAAVTLPTMGAGSIGATTQRAQFKSSLPKRMTAFRQIQKPLVLQKVPPPTTTATTTTTTTAASKPPTSSSTTTQPPDLSKIISLAPQKQRARIHVSRHTESAPEVGADSASEPAGDGQSLEAGDSNELRGQEQFTSTSERPFPSVESDPELPGSQPYADSELEVTTVSGNGSKLPATAANQSSEVDDAAESDEDSETDLDSLLPPIPDYNNNNKNETDGNDAEETRKVAAFATMPAADRTNNSTSRIALALVRNQRLDSDEEFGQSSRKPAASSSGSQPEPTFGDYLLPIVYQYHILIIAILFSMWLDSLRASSARGQPASRECPTQVGAEHLRATCRRQTWSSAAAAAAAADGSCESGGTSGRLVRSRSVESELGRRRTRGCPSRQRHCRRRQPHHLDEDSSSAGGQLSRSNSLRASSEQLLWAGGGAGQRRRNARFHSDDHRLDQESGDSSSSSDLSPRHHRRQPVAMITTEKEPASSACSVFLGLLVVSAALIVILVGTEILTLLTQCTTQLLSILVCLVGLCLAWRSQSALKKRSAKHRKCLHQQRATGRRLLLSRKGAAYLTNPHDIVLSTNTKTNQQSFAGAAPAGLVESSTPRTGSEAWPPPTEGSNHRQCFHYLFLLAAYFCGVSIALNLGKQHTVRQLFPPHIMQFLQRQLLANSGGGGGSRPANSHAHSLEHQQQQQQHDNSGMLFENWGFFWSQSPSQVGGAGGQEAPLSPLILFHMALAAKGLLLIVQVTLQTILIRSSCSQRTTRQLRQVYTFLMFTNLSLWAMDICEQQQHLQLVRQDGGHTLQLNGLAEDSLSSLTADNEANINSGDTRLKLITLEGFTQFASSIVTLSHLYHGLVFMQR